MGWRKNTYCAIVVKRKGEGKARLTSKGKLNSDQHSNCIQIRQTTEQNRTTDQDEPTPLMNGTKARNKEETA